VTATAVYRADPLGQLTAQWAAYAAESYETGRTDAAAEYRALWPAYPPLRPPGGPEPAELRTRATFADPRADDYPGTDTVL
jgi:hypothetical protein